MYMNTFHFHIGVVKQILLLSLFFIWRNWGHPDCVSAHVAFLDFCRKFYTICPPWFPLVGLHSTSYRIMSNTCLSTELQASQGERPGLFLAVSTMPSAESPQKTFVKWTNGGAVNTNACVHFDRLCHLAHFCFRWACVQLIVSVYLGESVGLCILRGLCGVWGEKVHFLLGNVV